MTTFEFTGGKQGAVAINGVDVSAAVIGFRLDAEVRAIPLVTLELAVTETSILAEGATVEVSQAVHELLGQLGWTPPTRDGI